MIVVAFAEYTSAPFYAGCDPPEILKKFLAIIAILFISIVNCLSVKVSLKNETHYSNWSSGSSKSSNFFHNCKTMSNHSVGNWRAGENW